ncbi:hypothetical protein QZH41_016686 [Actinostola sp. cb2023]|nr:hypothetical protein QZH41_016686 [Actinostola sp. cb2023]
MQSAESQQNGAASMAEHNKEIDSKFYIFLPHILTSNPVLDIDRGPRYSCFVGELLDFFLIAQFRGKNRPNTDIKKLHAEWQERLLGLCTSVSVSCIDVGAHKEHDAQSRGGFNTCSPLSSSRNRSNQRSELVQDTKPLVTSHGDIIYPLNVSLDVLPALSRRIKLSVNVWTPELNANAQISTHIPWNDYLDLFIRNDPDELLADVQRTFRCHVNATLPVVSPPTVQCKFNQINGKHYVALEVINSLGEPITLEQVSIHPSCRSHSNVSHSQRNCNMFVMHINTNKHCKCPVMMLPWEHTSFLYRVIYQDNHTSKDKYLEIPLISTIAWNVETLQLREQQIKTIYCLPLFNIRRSSVIVTASCESIIQKGKRFQVRYTVTNTEEEDECNVCLKWQPDKTEAVMAGMHNLDADSLVCLQPSIRIGCCPPGSSQSVNVEFLAVQEGLHEVGQFMICHWITGSQDNSPSKSLSPPLKGGDGFSTVSHSCQVFVVLDS